MGSHLGARRVPFRGMAIAHIVTSLVGLGCGGRIDGAGLLTACCSFHAHRSTGCSKDEDEMRAPRTWRHLDLALRGGPMAFFGSFRTEHTTGPSPVIVTVKLQYCSAGAGLLQADVNSSTRQPYSTVIQYASREYCEYSSHGRGWAQVKTRTLRFKILSLLHGDSARRL